MARVAWVFSDPVSLDSYSFEINPVEGPNLSYVKTFQYTNTSAPDGKVIVFEGRDNPQKFVCSGTLLSEAQLNALVSWWDRRNQIDVTDDLGRTFSIIIESLETTRQRAIHHPWKHAWNLTATIVDWP